MLQTSTIWRSISKWNMVNNVFYVAFINVLCKFTCWKLLSYVYGMSTSPFSFIINCTFYVCIQNKRILYFRVCFYFKYNSLSISISISIFVSVSFGVILLPFHGTTIFPRIKNVNSNILHKFISKPQLTMPRKILINCKSFKLLLK